MGILKFNDISIETPYELISILDIKLNHEISIHSTLEIHAICKEESFDPFYKTTLKDFVMLKKDDKTVFKGLIGYYNTKREGDLYSIIIKAVSATSLLDSQIKSQSFQAINMTYSNVINESIKDINGASFLFNLEDKTIDEPIIRYNETDWEFINRLVSHFSSVLVCDIIENKPRFYFGFNKKNTINIDDSLFYESSKDLLSLNLSVDKLMDTDVFYHEIKSREVYELQDTVNFKNKTLFISSIKGEFIKSELIFTYKLSRLKGIRQNKIYNENIKGASLEGKVLDTKEELVKLHLNIDDKQDKATAYWFKVAQLTNNVFYIMYEKDTFSRLYFPSNKEVEAEVKNSVRKNGSTCPLTKKPENRYLTTKDKNQMSLKPSSVEFKSNEGLKLSTLVEDSFGAKLISHKNINLNSKGSISFHAKNMVNIKAKTDVLFYRDNKLNPQSFTMENEFHYLGNNVLLEGADRSSYSSIGDDPLLVTPIKKSFDWGKLALGVLAGLAAVAAVTAVVATGGAALVAAGAITSATSAVTGAAVAGGIAVAAKAVTDIVRGEVSDITSYAMDGAIAAVCGAFSGAVEGAFAAANAFKAKLGVQMLSSIGSDAIEQIIRGEFDPISMGINVGFEIITLGCGELLTKTKIGKNISKKVSDKTTEIVEGIANRINKANEFKNNISKNLKNVFTLENLEKLSESLWTPKWYDDMFDKVVDSAENAIVNFRRQIDNFNNGRLVLAFEGIDVDINDIDNNFNNIDNHMFNSTTNENLLDTNNVIPNNNTLNNATVSPININNHNKINVKSGKRHARAETNLRNKLQSKVKDGQRVYSDDEIDDILNIRNTEYELTLEDNSTITIKRHGYMKKDAVGQSHHLSQDAAFKKVIPREEGLAIDLDGNIFTQRNSRHYKAHETMERFWDQFRIGGNRRGTTPTIREYNEALKDSMVNAGFTNNDAELITEIVANQQRRYNLFEDNEIPKIPGRLNAIVRRW